MVEYNQQTDMTGGPNLRCVRVEPPLPQWFRVVVPDPGILGNTPPPPPIQPASRVKTREESYNFQPINFYASSN